MSDESDKVLSYIGAAVLMAIFVPFIAAPFALLDGWALTKLWEWFVQPLGLPAMRIWPAVGFMLTISLLVKQHAHDERKWQEKFTSMVSFPLISVVFGWLVHLVMKP